MEKKQTKSKGIGGYIQSVDNFQQSHGFVGFPFAVIKKFGDDEAGYECALITYYGFWSLLPLFVAVTSALQLIFHSHHHFQQKIINSLVNYFPVFGNQLQHNTHSLGKVGVALVISIILTIYGARGGADAFRHAINHIWQVPRPQRAGFPIAVLKSLGVMLVAGVGLAAATILSSFATSLGRGFGFRILAIVISILVLFFAFLLIFKLAISNGKISFKDFFLSAAIAAIGLQILQTVGGYLITHELKNLSNLYGTFAFVLALLYWIYLQAQVVLYALEVGTVKALGLWPRSLTQNPLTPQDKKAYRLYAQKERYLPEPPEKVHVQFSSKK